MEKLIVDLCDKSLAVRITDSKLMVYESPYRVVKSVHKFLSPISLRDLKAKFDVDLRDIISFKVEGDLVKIKCFGIGDIILNLSPLNRRFLTDFLNLILSKGDLERFIVELDNLLLNNLSPHC